MGFWDTAGKIAATGIKKGAEKLREAREVVDKKYAQLSRYSDQQLKDRYRSGNTTDRIAIKKLLEERGYKQNN